MKNLSAFIDYLNELANDPDDSISKEVALEALSRDKEDIQNFFIDLLTRGCVTGMVTSLIYYTDTHKFFDKHYDEILGIKEDYEERIGQPMKIESDIRNSLSWFCFERVAFNILKDAETKGCPLVGFIRVVYNQSM